MKNFWKFISGNECYRMIMVINLLFLFRSVFWFLICKKFIVNRKIFIYKFVSRFLIDYFGWSSYIEINVNKDLRLWK